MTTDELLRQILADPTDAAARSVYADALMAAGDPRGELIAVECALDRTALPFGSASRSARGALDRPGALARRAALREAHARTWWPELPAHRIRTERGFATAISVAPERLDACARLFATEPIEEVELANGPLSEPTLPFAPAPWQARIRRLAIRGSVRPAQFTALCTSPLGAQLESLSVSGIAYTVAIEGGLPRCRKLGFAHTGLGYQATTLLRWRHLGALEELDLRSCIIEPHTLDEVLALDLGSLRVLRLSGNTLGAAGTRVLQQRLRRLPRLERLELVDCGVTDITHAAITEREDLPATVELVGATLELVPTGGGRYGLLVDGVRRPLRYRRVGSVDGPTLNTLVDWAVAEDAPLEPLFQAIALGLAFEPTEAGAIIQLAFEIIDDGYGRVDMVRDTLEIIFLGERVDLEHHSHLTTGT